MTTADFKDSLKPQADIVRIVGDYVKLKKAGAQNFSEVCPVQNEKTPSFSVHANTLVGTCVARTLLSAHGVQWPRGVDGMFSLKTSVPGLHRILIERM